jgi:hypothetical protein
MRGMSIMLLWAFVLSGCAAMSEKECKHADWSEVGQRDGLDGREPVKRLASYREACAKVNVKPDQTVYMAAWNHGVIDYCQPANAFSVGRRGATYEGVCTGKSANLFRINYDAGYRIYDLERQQTDVQNQIDTLEAKLQSPCGDNYKDDKDDKDCRLSADERRSINRKIGDLYDQLKVLRRLLAAAEIFTIVRDAQ